MTSASASVARSFITNFYSRYVCWFKRPGTASASNYIFANSAVQGNFTYNGTDGKPHTVNVFQMAQAYNPTYASTINPNVNTLIQNATNAVGGQGLTPLSDPTILQASFNVPATQTQYYPAARVDYNPTDKVRMYLSWIMSQSNPVGSFPPPFPGPTYASQNGNNFSRSFNANYGFDYIFTPRLVNQFKFGFLYNIQKFAATAAPNWQTNPVIFFNMTGDTANNRISGQNYSLPTGYEYPVFSLSDGLTYQKGTHNFNFGFQGYREQDHYYNAPGIPQINWISSVGLALIRRTDNTTAQRIVMTVPEPLPPKRSTATPPTRSCASSPAAAPSTRTPTTTGTT